VQNNSLIDADTSYNYLHTDQLGTPMLATDKQGNVVWKGVSEAFGATKPIESSLTMNLRLPGQYFDQETGTYYNFFRDYEPAQGRYLQSDPSGLDAGVNTYSYVSQNPVNSADPLGLFGPGGPGNPPGHGDMFCHNLFNYNALDEDKPAIDENYWLLDPRNLYNYTFNMWMHFRSLDDVVPDLDKALSTCDFKNYQYLMHEGQDVFSHYAQGYRAFAPWNSTRCLGMFGHWCNREADNNRPMWILANFWTKE
jgi:RHS repeat-associated protein